MNECDSLLKQDRDYNESLHKLFHLLQFVGISDKLDLDSKFQKIFYKKIDQFNNTNKHRSILQ